MTDHLLQEIETLPYWDDPHSAIHVMQEYIGSSLYAGLDVEDRIVIGWLMKGLIEGVES